MNDLLDDQNEINKKLIEEKEILKEIIASKDKE